MRLMRTLAFSILLSVAFCGCTRIMSFFQPPPPPVPAPQDIVVDTLPNGVTVLVKPSRTTPVVTVRGFVRSGGLYEGKYLGCGISHLTEHLVALGAEHLMEGQTSPAGKEPNVPDRVRQIGGQANAYTSLDHTCYHISAEASKAGECIDLIADWLARPQMTQADFNREHGVVQREIEMSKDDPGRQLWYAHAANLFGDHPAGVPVIGYLEPLSRLTFADVQDYYARSYVPQNMVLVIVGDVDVQACLDRVRKALGDLPRGRAVDLGVPAVPPVVGVRRRGLEMPALSETLQELSFQTVPLVHEDLYALDVLSDILAASPTSRLPERILRQRKLVTAIDTSSWTPPWGRGAFSVSFRCAPDKADEAEAAILAELQAVAQRGVSQAELEQGKREKITQWVLSQQSVESQAATLGSDYLSTGDAAFSADYTRRIQDVTAAQVRDVARRYLALDRMVVTRLTPPSTGAASAPAEGGRLDQMAEAFTLSNGLRVILQPLPAKGGRGLVAMAMVTEGGLLLEDEETNGLGALMMALSIKGAGNLSADAIAKAFHTLSGECGNNTFFWQATVLDDRFLSALEVFGQVILRPTFSPQELDILRPAQLAAIQRVDQEWSSRLNKLYREQFFARSPYALLPVGRQDVVAAATPEQLAAHHHRCVKAGGSVLAICGQVDRAVARLAIERIFAAMPTGRVAMRLPPLRSVAPTGEQYVVKVPDQPVAGVIVAAPGMKVSDVDDRLAIDVLDTILSGYQLPSGWLHDELRGKRLVYMVHAYNWPGLAPGAFVTIAACEPANATRVVAIIKNDLAKATTYLPSQREVDEAVNVILTAEMLDNQSAASLALSSALDELYGLGYDWRRRMVPRYRAITPKDVCDVGAKYLSKPLVTVVTTPLEGETLRGTSETSATAPASAPVTQPATEPASGPAITGETHAPE
ncbi:MAG: insulinase family protein [Phycisphaerae bacterium]|nr:insulinase family protein [Phycisphaerae bacterium]